ncbi:YggS family pyridoxal phosphate-dependent enzyme [Salinicola endophyticus]|uniref:Pyridoxal phosphate homeostasis protein n=1 Tax=Salinicola endophyticus TaxID=1949083 RepID=A0ABY8FDM0_9GAMM|nr:YggS family pyridoxal phosphate-dependent enzyme [Salinicola endophyticus]WFF40907.1 YggS family pyridoxal phosphate-dependent enzyme [Salinicola endophyticus]
MPEASVPQSLHAANQRLQNALQAAGRPAQAARILAVSKTKPAAMLRQAYDAGQRAFGENYLQEALEKQAQLAALDDIEWHFIGALQSNKTRDVAEHFAWVHSVEREKIARRLSDQRPPTLAPLNVCLQLNVSGEASKAGVDAEALPALAEALLGLPNLRLRGLMALPAPSDDPARQREAFRAVRVAFEGLRTRFPEAPLDTLSMGMSGDLEAAVAEGATLVRLGTAIFGSRPPVGARP